MTVKLLTRTRRPWFAFYPQAWLGNVNLQRCSDGAHGLWIHLLCLMHKGEPYGHLAFNGKPVMNEEIPQLIHSIDKPGVVLRALQELEENGIAKRNSDGVIFSRMMIENEDSRNRSAARTRKHRAKQ